MAYYIFFVKFTFIIIKLALSKRNSIRFQFLTLKRWNVRRLKPGRGVLGLRGHENARKE